jgi:hypothetical protein
LMEPTLPSSMALATRGGVFGSPVCGARRCRHFNVESMPLFVGQLGFNLGEVRSVRLLQAASYCGGCGVRGLTGFFLARGVASILKSWSVAFWWWARKGHRWADGPCGHRRCCMDVPLLVFDCRAWLAFVVSSLVVGARERWQVVVGGRGAPSYSLATVFDG